MDHGYGSWGMDRMCYRGMDRNLTFWAAAIYVQTYSIKWSGMVLPLWRLLTDPLDLHAAMLCCANLNWENLRKKRWISGIAPPFWRMFFHVFPAAWRSRFPILSECLAKIQSRSRHSHLFISFLVTFSSCIYFRRGTYTLFSRSTHCLFKRCAAVLKFW